MLGFMSFFPQKFPLNDGNLTGMCHSLLGLLS